MKTLELKHVLPYVPFGLKAILSQEGKFNLDSEYPNEHQNKLCTITDFSISSGLFSGSMRVDGTKNYSFDFESMTEIQIALRPLSYLTKEIEVDGEKFVPIERLPYADRLDYYIPLNVDYCLEITLETENYSQSINLYDGYVIMSMLFQWYFDVFNLIPQGKAIDLNTIKNG